MKLLLSGLLLASVHAASSRSTPVTQTPDVSVVEGETVNITCCWTRELGRIRVTWMKNQIDIGSEIVTLKNRLQVFLDKATSHCSHLTFMDVTREDSGRYVCRVTVEAPLLRVGEGNGTIITVTARDDTADSTAGGSHQEVVSAPGVLIYVVRCLPILALVIAFFCINNVGTKAQQHTPAAPGNEAQRIEEIQDEED